MSSSISAPPIYGQSVEIVPVNQPAYFPTIPSRYRRPGLSQEVRLQLDNQKKERIEEAFKFLANLDPSSKKIEKSTTCVTNNSVINLFSYLCCNKLKILRNAFCCCLEKENKYLPIPRGASETLELTREQFDRNTLGVCCIAPAVIIATPFIPAGATLEAFLGIFSGLVITTTAGTNTYVFSGDIGVVPNGKDDLCVQGGIRVDAIALIHDAYAQMAERMTEKWDTAVLNHDDVEKKAVITLCNKISSNWDFIISEIASCGLKSTAVENILAKFAVSLDRVFDNQNDAQVAIHLE